MQRSSEHRPCLVVSACLLGLCTRLDGGHNRSEAVLELAARFNVVPICPEQLGGLPTPRPPAEIQGTPSADEEHMVVRTREGTDVSDQFRRGAEAALAVARLVGARSAVLKARSPSCGVDETYDGTFSHTLRPGSGVAADLLRRAGMDLYTEEHIAAGREPS
ncbi:MAG: 2-thiouracil desulfurase family protein [Thermoleophilia bacterium]